TWCGARSATSPAPDRRPRRTAGRRTKASTPTRWRRSSRQWSPARRSCRRAKPNGRWRLLISGTPISRRGWRSTVPNWAGGPVWHRYCGDGYGEQEDGTAYDGTGIGRGWPLLTGERGMYELCAGNDPLPYLEAMAAMASPGGMLPEQVWDTESIPDRFLFLG